MCGRFAQIEPVDVIAHRLHVVDVQVKNMAPRYNICPGEDIVVLVHHNGNLLRELRWGLIPHWVKGLSRTKPLINARSETVILKPSFKKAFLHNRCIILASGFFEWKNEGNKKIPYYITADHTFGFAGIYDTVTIDGKTLTTCAILTTQANEQMSEIHSRMPAIIPQHEFDTWILHSSIEILAGLLKPYSERLIMYPVSSKVNNPAYKEPDCINPV